MPLITYQFSKIRSASLSAFPPRPAIFKVTRIPYYNPSIFRGKHANCFSYILPKSEHSDCVMQGRLSIFSRAGKDSSPNPKGQKILPPPP